MTDLAAGQVLTATTFNNKVRRRIARARRTTTSSSSSGSLVAVLRLDDKPVLAGINYEITASVHADGDTADLCFRTEIRYTTDGSTPTTASPVLPGSGTDESQRNASFGTSQYICTDYTPAGDESLSLLLCIIRLTAAGAVGLQADGTTYLTMMYLDSMGDDPGDTGTDL